MENEEDKVMEDDSERGSILPEKSYPSDSTLIEMGVSTEVSQQTDMEEPKKDEEKESIVSMNEEDVEDWVSYPRRIQKSGEKFVKRGAYSIIMFTFTTVISIMIMSQMIINSKYRVDQIINTQETVFIYQNVSTCVFSNLPCKYVDFTFEATFDELNNISFVTFVRQVIMGVNDTVAELFWLKTCLDDVDTVFFDKVDNKWYRGEDPGYPFALLGLLGIIFEFVFVLPCMVIACLLCRKSLRSIDLHHKLKKNWIEHQERQKTLIL